MNADLRSTWLLERAGNTNMDYIFNKLILLPGIIVGLCFHEAAHAAMSNALGDPTPKQQGRLTINPIAHIDIIGFICLILFGFGWGKPVMIDPRYYKHRRRDEFLVSIAGVSVNLMIAVILSFAAKMASSAYFASGSSLLGILHLILVYAVMINLVLMIFNLIPVPPLDGFGIITQIFKLDEKPWYVKLYNYGTPILMILIVFNITDYIISPLVSFFMGLLGL